MQSTAEAAIYRFGAGIHMNTVPLKVQVHGSGWRPLQKRLCMSSGEY
jgi:hypothetical protein